MLKNSKLRTDFWTRYKFFPLLKIIVHSLQGRADLTQLYETGLAILKSSKKIAKKWETMNAIYPHHFHARLLYSHYLKDIIQNEQLATKTLKQAHQIDASKTAVKSLTNDKIFSDETLTLVISANLADLGKIKVISKNIVF